MILKQISISEYEKLLDKVERYDFLNMPEYIKLANDKIRPIILLAGYEDNVPVIICPLSYFRLKKIFKLAQVNYSPLFLVENNKEQILDEFLKLLIKFVKKDKFIVSLRIVSDIRKTLYNNFDKIEDDKFGTNAIRIFKENGFTHLPYEYYEPEGIKLALFSRSSYVRKIDKDNYEELLKTFNVPSLRIAPLKAYGLKVKELPLNEFSEFKNFADETYSKKGIKVNAYPNWIDSAEEYFGDKVKFIACYVDINESVNKLEEVISTYQSDVNKYTDMLEKNPNSKKVTNKLKEANELYETNKNRINDLMKLKETVNSDIVYLYSAFFIIAKNEVYYVSAGRNQDVGDILKGQSIYPVQEYMLRYAIEHGKKYYNFLGTTPYFGEDAPDFGVQKFKKNFNGNIEEFIGTFQIECSKFAKYILPHYDLVFKR